jgi:hypothetical protein
VCIQDDGVFSGDKMNPGKLRAGLPPTFHKLSKSGGSRKGNRNGEELPPTSVTGDSITVLPGWGGNVASEQGGARPVQPMSAKKKSFLSKAKG